VGSAFTFCPWLRVVILIISKLTADRVHVWCINLDRDREEVLKLSQDLDAAELARANKFIKAQHRDRWIVARSYLRRILSLYLDIPPEKIEFGYASLGKPHIIGAKLEFNLSHSEGLAVYGIGTVHPIGIDIEHTRSLPVVELVNRFFSPTERDIFHALPPTLHQAAFFHAWTQKEAYLKASGTGLHTPLDRIEVSIDPRTLPQILNITEGNNPIGDWHLEGLNLPTNYTGAVAIAAPSITIEYQSWTID
jgi:4'-phosphopantetheinyl transferase